MLRNLIFALFAVAAAAGWAAAPGAEAACCIAPPAPPTTPKIPTDPGLSLTPLSPSTPSISITDIPVSRLNVSTATSGDPISVIAVGMVRGQALGFAQSLSACPAGGGSNGELEVETLPFAPAQDPAPARSTPVTQALAQLQQIAVQAICLDDKGVPHPASQVTPEREIDNGYQGEVFRCIAGAHMQAAIAPYSGDAHFEHASTVVCGKNEALVRTANKTLVCQTQIKARDCNERSLLRRYGPGIKVLYARAPDPETPHEPAMHDTRLAHAACGGGLALEGGVGWGAE